MMELDVSAFSILRLQRTAPCVLLTINITLSYDHFTVLFGYIPFAPHVLLTIILSTI